jgi:Tol biopolymer transport system component
MNDLHDRFRSLDDLSTPDLWREVEARAEAMPHRGFRTVPWAVVAVMLLLLALAIGSAVLIGSRIIKLPVFLDASATPATSPSAEPATGRIAFGRRDPFASDYVVYLIDPDGTSERQLLPGLYECPRWSPNGRDISLGSGIFENAGQSDGRFRAFATFALPTRYLPDPTLNLGCPIWSPDGSRLAYEGWDDSDPARNGIYTLDAVDGSDLKRLTSSPDGGHDIPGDYSADGSELFFARWDGLHGETGPIMAVGMDGSDPRQVTTERYGMPSLSPDGQTLVAKGERQLYLIAADGSSATPIPIPDDATPVGAFWPSWSPDGRWIVFPILSRTHGPGVLAIARVRPDGSGLFQITDSASAESFPDWAP